MKQKIKVSIVFMGLFIGVSSMYPTPYAAAQTSGGNSIPAGCPGTNQEGPKAPGVVCPQEEPDKECEGGGNCCNGVRTSIISSKLCGDSSSGQGGTLYKLLVGILQILTAGVGVAAVGGIAYGALLYTSAGNNASQTQKAIGIITNVVIGLIAYALMFVLLNFLIPGGVFSI